MNKEHIIVEAKAEYTKQLLSLLTEPVYIKMIDIYNNTVAQTKNKREIIINTQRSLQDIPLWNQSHINHEVNKITSKCSWLDDLIAAIFISNVKILTSVKIGSDKKKIQITMPKTDAFIHNVYINTANDLYNNPLVFTQQNAKPEIIALVQRNIESTIRTMLPFQNILQSYLGQTLHADEEQDEDTESIAESEDCDVSDTASVDVADAGAFSDIPTAQPQFADVPTVQEIDHQYADFATEQPHPVIPAAPVADVPANDFFAPPTNPNPAPIVQNKEFIRDVQIQPKDQVTSNIHQTNTTPGPMFFPDATD